MGKEAASASQGVHLCVHGRHPSGSALQQVHASPLKGVRIILFLYAGVFFSARVVNSEKQIWTCSMFYTIGLPRIAAAYTARSWCPGVVPPPAARRPNDVIR